MAINLPPPPQQAEPGSRVWSDWFRKLQLVLSSAEGIAWGQINKTGSSLADLAVRLHSSLTGVQGNGSYHLSATEQARVAGVISKAGDPTTTDIAAGQWALYKNTSSGTLKLWSNDGGVMKSVTLA